MLTAMTRISARPRLRTLLVLCAACWLLLGQLDGVLKLLQEGGVGAYGANAFGPLSPIGLQDKVRQLLAIWNTEPTLAITTFSVYTAIDLVFIAVYGWLLLTLAELLGVRGAAASPLDRLARRAPELTVLAMAADVLEDLLRTVMVTATVSSWLVVYVAWALTTMKWLLLAAVVAGLVHAWRRMGLVSGPGAITADVWWAIKRLRIPILLLGAWGLIVLFDPTQQTADTFRRWLDDLGSGLSDTAWTFGTAALLGLATWAAIRRAVLANSFVETAKPPRWWLWLAMLVALGVGVTLGWTNLLGFAVAIGLVFLITAFVWLLERREQRDERGTAQERAARRQRIDDAAVRQRHELAGAPVLDDRVAAVQRVGRAVATWPLLALLLALASAWTAPAVLLLAVGRDETRALIAAALTVVAVVAAALVLGAVPALLGRWDKTAVDPETRFEVRYLLFAVLCLAACAAAIAFPFDVPPSIGVVGVTALAITALVLLLLEGQRYGDGHPPTYGLRVVGFVRIPVTLLLIVALAVASAVDDGSSHAVARNDQAAPQPEGITIEAAFAAWGRRNCTSFGGPGRTIPLVLVASHGGGIRAAYWTTSVLTQLFASPTTSAEDPTCPGATAYDRVFAMSGASGGSLGEASYVGHPGDTAAERRPWFRRIWGATDLVSVPVSWGLLVDLPRSLVGFGGPDRARRFEESWERQDPTLHQDFFAEQGEQAGPPLLLLAGTQVESGCRMNVSAIRLTAAATLSSPAECAALAARPGSGGDGPDQSGPLLANAATTTDVLDHLCGTGSLNRSTAALLSARFPYVSPSGQLPGCGARDDETTAVVDGGYAENTGGQAALNLWQRLEPLVAAHNRTAGTTRIVPVFVHVDNHYGKAARAGAVRRTPELVVPPHVYRSVDKLDDRGVEQAANAAFSVALPGLPGSACAIGTGPGQRYVRIAPTEHPGIQAPLAWTLSAMAMDDLDQQREHAFGDVALHDESARGGAVTPVRRLADVLHGAALRCSG
jgi:hypothetical protein